MLAQFSTRKSRATFAEIAFLLAQFRERESLQLVLELLGVLIARPCKGVRLDARPGQGRPRGGVWPTAKLPRAQKNTRESLQLVLELDFCWRNFRRAKVVQLLLKLLLQVIPMANIIKMTDRVKAKFIAALTRTANVSQAARAAQISRKTAYARRASDAAFAEQWKEALETACDALEAEAWRRAVEGVDDPVYYQGQKTGTRKVYSTRLMELLLKAHRPQKYKERIASEVTGRDGGPVEIRTDAGARLKEFLDRLAEQPARNCADQDAPTTDKKPG